MRPAAITRDTVTGTVRPDQRIPASLFGALVLVWVGTAGAQGQGGTIDRPVFMPGIRASTTFTDNALFGTGGNKDAGFIHEVSPYLTASSNSPRAHYELNYQLRNLWLAGVDSPDTHRLRHAFNGRGSFALLDDRLWLDLTGYMGMVNNSLTGPLAVDPGASFVNTSALRRFTISPWYRDRIGNTAEYQLRYLAAHTGGDTGFAIAKLDQRATASINSLRTNASPWSWTLDSGYQHRDFGGGISRDRVNASGNLGYRINPTLRIYGILGYERIEALRNEKGKDSGFGPGAGFEWAPNARVSVSGSVSDQYYGTASQARVTYTTQRSTFGLSYSRGVYTSSDASLLAFDPTQLNSGEFNSATLNPVLTGLIGRGIVFPPGISLTQSLITDAAMLDRRISLFYGLTGNRNALSIQAFNSDRTSTTELESAIGIGDATGSSRNVFSGEIKERGLIVTYQYRLDARTSIDVAYDLRRLSSPTAGFSTRYSTVRLGVGAWLTADTQLFAGIRRTEQESAQGASRYNENAAYGGIDVRFR